MSKSTEESKNKKGKNTKAGKARKEETITITYKTTSNKKTNNTHNTKKRRKKKSTIVAKRIVVTILLLFIFSLFAIIGFRIQQNGGGLSGTLATILGEDSTTLENLKPIQVLVMGESGVDEYKLADTIMVVSYNPKNQSASILSIPRDTYVGKQNRHTASTNYLASYKINTVYRSGTNIEDAIDRINDLTGLELENYVIVNTDALIKIVDEIGGVTFNVPIDMNYEDSGQDLYIHLKAGEQLIDGEKAEQLLRFRHNDDGSTYPASYGMEDLGRMRTQREFIMATLEQTLKPHNIFKIKQILDIVSNNVKTNMDISSLKSYVPSAVKFNVDNIKTGVVPGESEMCNGVSIYVADKADTEELVEELFGNKEVEEIDEEQTGEDTGVTTSLIKVEVLNGSGDSDVLEEVVDKLESAGYIVSKQGNTNTTQKTTITNKTNKGTSVAESIKDIIGVGTIVKGSDNSNVDFHIIIGRDYNNRD